MRESVEDVQPLHNIYSYQKKSEQNVTLLLTFWFLFYSSSLATACRGEYTGERLQWAWQSTGMDVILPNPEGIKRHRRHREGRLTVGELKRRAGCEMTLIRP